MAIRRNGFGVFVSIVALVALSALPVASAGDDVRGVAPSTSDNLGAPPKTVVLEDVDPGTVLWTRTIPDTGPATTGVARPDDLPPIPPAYPAADPAPMWPEDEMPAEPPPVEGPVLEEVPAPMPPSAPVLVRQPQIVPTGDDCTEPCGQRRDDCCYAVDWCGNRYGCWEVTLEGTASLMNDPQGPLGEPIFGPGAPGYDWDLLDYEFEFGGRGAIRYQARPQTYIELRGAYYGSWDDTSSQPGRRFGFLPTPPFVSGVSNGVLNSEADLIGFELNYINEITCTGCVRFDYLAGVRWLSFEEEARVDFAPNAGLGLFTPGFVNSDVENTLVAGQLGGVVHWDVTPRFEVTATIKAILGNLNRDATVTDANIFVGGPHGSTSEEDEIVFGADLELGFKYRVTPRIAITAGYNMLFLDNVLRANDAMDFTKSVSGAVQARQELDQLIVHTVFVGFNFNF